MRIPDVLRLLRCLVLAPVLVACSLSPFVDQDVVDYFRVNDLASNRVILLNVLRAKDGAPLHFSELSQIRGQISAGASAAVSFPFGAQMHVTSVRRSSSLSGTVSTAPSFDVVSLDTEDFTRGVMTPIRPETFKFFLDEGEDYRLVLLLLASGARLAGSPETLLNAPDSTRIVCYPDSLGLNQVPTSYTILAAEERTKCTGQSEPEFYGFLRIINNLRRLYAVERVPSRPVGRPFVLDAAHELRDLARLDPQKYRLQKAGADRVQLVASGGPSLTVLCQEATGGAQPMVTSVLQNESGETPKIPADACVVGGTPNPGDEAGREAASTGVVVGHDAGTLVIGLRSTLAVIQYVGRVLAFQEAETLANPQGTERCITVEYEMLSGPTCSGNVLFRLQHAESPTGIGLTYDGAYWAVPPSRRCLQFRNCDFTLKTLAMISLLLNQNKSAKDIPKTPAFEAVP